MLNVITILLIILIIYQLFGNLCYEFFMMEHIPSKIDNVEYKVVKKYSDKEMAADIIADMNMFAARLIKELKAIYIDNPSDEFKKTKEYAKGVHLTNLMIRRFNPKAVMENESTSPELTSYTTNKGEVISLCLREKQSGENKFHDMTTLQFVFIHELAHIVTEEHDHVVNFWINFKFLLEFCDKHQLYKTKNYHKENIQYCGMAVTYSPIEDKALPSYFSNR